MLHTAQSFGSFVLGTRREGAVRGHAGRCTSMMSRSAVNAPSVPHKPTPSSWHSLSTDSTISSCNAQEYAWSQSLPVTPVGTGLLYIVHVCACVCINL